MPGVMGLVEIHREDIQSLPRLLGILREGKRPVRIFVTIYPSTPRRLYKSLKAVLEGGFDGRADQRRFYATSNRRH
jgi:predicted AAA+ superfamily ATPase